MSDPIEELYCADCGQWLLVDRLPLRNAGSSSVQWINGRIHCTTTGCLAQRGAVDRNGNAVKV